MIVVVSRRFDFLHERHFRGRFDAHVSGLTSLEFDFSNRLIHALDEPIVFSESRENLVTPGEFYGSRSKRERNQEKVTPEIHLFTCFQYFSIQIHTLILHEIRFFVFFHKKYLFSLKIHNFRVLFFSMNLSILFYSSWNRHGRRVEK